MRARSISSDTEILPYLEGTEHSISAHQMCDSGFSMSAKWWGPNFLIGETVINPSRFVDLKGNNISSLAPVGRVDWKETRGLLVLTGMHWSRLLVIPKSNNSMRDDSQGIFQSLLYYNNRDGPGGVRCVKRQPSSDLRLGVFFPTT